MDIIKNKRKSKCRMCGKEIQSYYKVVRNSKIYHLRCYYVWVERTLKILKDNKKKLNRYKKHMLLEGLE